MPDDIHFKSLEERIVHMANVTASVGELEILSTAGHLQQTIVIVDKDFQKISVYRPGDAASAVLKRWTRAHWQYSSENWDRTLATTMLFW